MYSQTMFDMHSTSEVMQTNPVKQHYLFYQKVT